jgi:hypothetical protein
MFQRFCASAAESCEEAKRKDSSLELQVSGIGPKGKGKNFAAERRIFSVTR